MSFFGNHINLTPASQSDWNKNNSKDAAYIKNRPFFVDANGEVHKLNKKFLPNEVAMKEDIKVTSVNGMTGDVIIPISSGGTGVAVQPDWSQNNQSAPDYIKNRTHYVGDPREVTVVSGTAGEYPRGELSTHIELEEGKLYTVTVNGVKYELTAQYESSMDITYLGNPSYLGGPDNGSNAPFLILFNALYAPYDLYNISISVLVDDVWTILTDETIYLCWDWCFDDGILEAGHEYKVIFDGIEYNFTATENADSSAIIIGDMTQDPFDIWYTYDSLILYSLTPGIHTISMMDITGGSEIIEYQNIGLVVSSQHQIPHYEIKEGQTYSVQFGDNTYSCVAKKYYDFIYLGNPVYVYLDGGPLEPNIQSTGEPFIYVYWTEEKEGFITSDIGSIDNFSITTMESKVHTLDPKFLPEGMGYIETVNSIILSEDRFDGFAVMQEPLYAISIPLEFEPVIDGEYTVRWDGADYTVPCIFVSGVFCLGNTNYADMLPGGDIPFAIISPPGFEEVYFVTESIAESHTVAISGSIKVVHKMDRDCLPEDAVTSVNGMTGDVTIEAGGVGKAGVGENAEAFNGLNNWNAFGSYSHAEGEESYAVGQSSHAENQSVAAGSYSHAEGVSATYRGMSFSGNANSTTYIYYDLAPPVGIWLLYNNRFAEIIGVNEEDNTFVVSEPLLDRDIIYPQLAYAKSLSSGAFGYASHAEGEQTSARGLASHAEGSSSRAIGEYSHAEGWSSEAWGNYSHAEGFDSLTIGDSSHSENYARAIGSGSHAENGAITYGTMSHAEGISYLDGEEIKRFSYEIINEDDLTTFKITYDFNNYFKNYIQIGCLVNFGTEISWFKVINFNESEKTFTIDAPFDGYFDTNTHYAQFYSGGIASGDYSHSEGIGTIAGSQSQHVQGRYNLIDSNDRYAHIVGNGDGPTNPERSNAHTLDWEGNAWFQGDVFVGGTSQDDADRLVKLSEIGNIGGGGSGTGVQPDWNQTNETAPDYIKNKPFEVLEEGFEIVWDGNMDDEDKIIVNDDYFKIYYVSDVILTAEQVQSSILTLKNSSTNEEVEVDLSTMQDQIVIEEDYITIGNAVIITNKDNVDFQSVIFPKAGTYFTSVNNGQYIAKLGKPYNIKTLELKYLPITYSIDDLEAGISPLETGTLYFVYE